MSDQSMVRYSGSGVNRIQWPTTMKKIAEIEEEKKERKKKKNNSNCTPKQKHGDNTQTTDKTPHRTYTKIRSGTAYEHANIQDGQSSPIANRANTVVGRLII